MKKILLTILIIITILSINVLAVDIDIGSAAIDRATYSTYGYTWIAIENPANASGKITSVEIRANTNLSNCEVAIFYNTGGLVFSTRSNVAIGTVTAGSKQTFNVDLAVEEGDYIGIYFSAGRIEADANGDGYWWKSGDYIPCTDTTFALFAERTISLYGTGTTTIGWDHKWNTKEISKWNTKEFTKWNDLE